MTRRYLYPKLIHCPQWWYLRVRKGARSFLCFLLTFYIPVWRFLDFFLRQHIWRFWPFPSTVYILDDELSNMSIHGGEECHTHTWGIRYIERYDYWYDMWCLGTHIVEELGEYIEWRTRANVSNWRFPALRRRGTCDVCWLSTSHWLEHTYTYIDY